MYGLTMIKDYLDEILDGKKTYDARSYPTNKRGTIALIDSRSLKIYGYVDLVGIHEISLEEYVSWHCSGRFKGLVFNAPSGLYNFYAYDFKNPRRVKEPIKILGEKHTWMKI